MFGLKSTSTRELAICISVFILMSSVGQADAHNHRQHQNIVCSGFVILPNGHAVLSQEEPSIGISSNHHRGQAHGEAGMKNMKKKMVDKGHHHDKAHDDHAMSKEGKMSMKSTHQMQGHGHKTHQSHERAERSHLMGYHHGTAIVTKDKMLCVPLGSPSDTAWMTVGKSNTMTVTVESLQSSLAHNSRTNEGLKLTVLKLDTSELMQPSRVRVFVRMPHHDNRMMGGHGVANDPDVAGLDAQLDKAGHYTVPTLDFTMAGPWLIEVEVTDGAKIHKVYFAAHVGEE